MNAADLREHRNLCNAEHVAKALGLERSKEERKKRKCPGCGSSNLSITVPNTLRAKCFSCDLSGDIFNLIGAAYRLDLRSSFLDVKRIAADIAGVTWTDGPRSLPRRAPVPPPEPPPSYAPGVLEFWEACARLETDPELSAYLRGRGLDPRDVQTHGLARVLPKGAPCPTWAACGRTWSASGHRIVLPAFDSTGELRGVRAWSPTEPKRKRLAPAGYSIKGLVLADLDGLAMLQGEGPSRERVMVCEGEPDFLTASLLHPLTERDRGAFLGVASGSWSDELAARIPDGAVVRIATDPDEPGDKYAHAIAATLSRRCDVRRVRAAA